MEKTEVKDEDKLDIKTKTEIDTSTVKQEFSFEDKSDSDSKPDCDSSISWPSLWQNGPRRSAFQPYRPTRGASSSIAVISVPPKETERPPSEPRSRSASTTALTNLQRGNMQTEALPETARSWFTLAGRGDITADYLQEMIKQGKDLDCVDEEGMSALMWAAFHGQTHTVQLLLEQVDVDVDREGESGETALMLAATEGHLEIVRELLGAGAFIDHEDHNHSTALMCAAYGDHPHTVRELLCNGADLWTQNIYGFTAYGIAEEQNSLRAKAVLEKHIVALLTGS